MHPPTQPCTLPVWPISPSPLSPNLVPRPLTLQVDEEYLEALLLLGRKIAFISTNTAAAGSAAAKEVAAVLEKLRIRAIVKVSGPAGGPACTVQRVLIVLTALHAYLAAGRLRCMSRACDCCRSAYRPLDGW